MNFWQRQGQYEYEVTSDGKYSGWVRYVGGKMVDGRWPEFNIYSGQTRGL